jgi:hypothetical protein
MSGLTGRRTDPAPAVWWEMDHDTALDLVHILGILEDFLRLASHDVVDELARFPTARPLDASTWAHWLADYLGDQAVALRAATRVATVPTATEPTPTGDLP